MPSVAISQETLKLEVGASHAPTFSKKTTHLLCPSRQGPKAEKAVEWGIPIVDTSWLESLLVSTTNSPVVEGGVNLLPPLCKDRGGGAGQIDTTPEPVLKRVLLCLSASFL